MQSDLLPQKLLVLGLDGEQKLIIYIFQTNDYSIEGTDNRKKSVLLQPLPISLSLAQSIDNLNGNLAL